MGLRPEQGGKNFKFKKNENRIYMSSPEDAEMWADKLRDLSGEQPLRLRAPVSAQTPPGANSAVRVRTEAVPPELLQYRNPTGDWRSVKRLLDQEAAAAPGADPRQLDFDYHE